MTSKKQKKNNGVEQVVQKVEVKKQQKVETKKKKKEETSSSEDLTSSDSDEEPKVYFLIYPFNHVCLFGFKLFIPRSNKFWTCRSIYNDEFECKCRYCPFDRSSFRTLDVTEQTNLTLSNLANWSL